MKPSTPLAAAAIVLAIGGVAWLVPHHVLGGVSGVALPGLSLAALAATLYLAKPWPRVRLCLCVMAVALAVGWFRAGEVQRATSHFLGTSLGLLLMVVTGIWCAGSGIRWGLLSFLGAGLAALGLGVLGADLATLDRLGTWTGVHPARMLLGLEGIGAGGVNANALAAAALLIGPLAVAAAFSSGVRPVPLLFVRLLGAAAAIVSALVLVVSHSRTAWLAVWLTVVVLLVRGRLSRLARGIAGASVVAAPLVLIAGIYASEQRIFMEEAANLWRSVSDRGSVMRAGVRAFRASPLLGIGLSQYPVVAGPLSALPLQSPAGTQGLRTVRVADPLIVPAPGEAIRITLRHEGDAPSGGVVWQHGDWVRLTSEDPAMRSDIWGIVRDVTSFADTETWTFQRGVGVNAGSAKPGQTLETGSLAIHYGSGYHDVAHAHNMLLQTGLDLGVIGLLAYVGMMGLLLLRGSRLVDTLDGFPRHIVAGASISLVAVSLFGLADCVALGAKIGLFQWFAAGVILSAHHPSAGISP